jgi:hypothetical protein
VSANRYTEPMSLDGFVRYFLALDFAHMAPVEFFNFGPVLSLVLYRDPIWQAELFILLPGTGFPREHRHPDVDACEYDLDGAIPFQINGRAGESLWPGAARPLYEVNSTDWHGVGDVPKGGHFLSLQRWKNGVAPTSVGLNWCGTPVSEEHRRMLRQPGALWVKTLKRNDQILQEDRHV